MAEEKCLNSERKRLSPIRSVAVSLVQDHERASDEASNKQRAVARAMQRRSCTITQCRVISVCEI